jgi:hypothetical protein
MNSQYEKVYGVGLFDDLHNYLPSILYEPHRFRSVPDLLAYIQQTARARFNLFDVGRRQYSSQIPQNIFVSNPPTIRPRASEVEVEFGDLAELLPFLRNMIIPSTPVQRARGLFQDVIVSASQDIINSGSSVRTLLADLEENCSICQDRMKQGDQVRRLNTCRHEFHGTCVDNWFLERSVFCPICRHDIRSRPVSTPASPSPNQPRD